MYLSKSPQFNFVQGFTFLVSLQDMGGRVLLGPGWSWVVLTVEKGAEVMGLFSLSKMEKEARYFPLFTPVSTNLTSVLCLG